MTGETGQLDRRSFLRNSGMAAVGLQAMGLSGFLAACGRSSNSTASPSGPQSTTLKMAFLLDMQIPDPDIMYEGEGLQVMLSCYEGLINYKPGSNEFVPGLAESWTVSDDLLTYTFKLRTGVKFHDGTPMNAESWVKGYKRRLDVNEGPAYMVMGVTATAVDESTLQLKLEAPNDAYLDYLACPWQPYAVSPTAVEKNATDGDLAQEWLKSHDAGTGPYTIKEFVPASHYTLEAFPDYWGPKPAFTTLRIEIIPDVSTQRLKLESGEIDMVTKGFATEDVISFQSNPKFKVVVPQETSVIALWINATGGVFTDKKLRQAMLKAIDREAVIKPTYQTLTKVETGMYPATIFPEGKAPFTPTYDQGPLKALVGSMPDKSIDLAYSESGGAPFRRMAELIQTQLSQAGLDVQVRGMPSSQVFALAKGSPDQRPDLLLWVYGGDALHVDTFLRIFVRTGAAPLNWCQYTNTELDQVMDEAIVQPTKDKVNEKYVEAADIQLDEAWYIPLARRPSAIITRTGISNIVSNTYIPSIFSANLLKAE